ncbi:MAG: ABC transporter substrate-binding protein, partial [Armatimonadota bacterium]|nr:ABC transporter substrate-binding protein [Armatimonadota bacterium]
EFVRNVYEGLLEIKPRTVEVGPLLAARWSVSADGLTYRFTLRQGVRFHDGAPLTAQAAKIGLERIRQVNQGPASLMSNIRSIQATGPYELTIRLAEPDVYFLGRLAKLPLVSPKALADHRTSADPLAKDWFATHAAGTGPYRLVRWIKNNRIELERSPGYWRPWPAGAPTTVILRVDPNVSTALQLLQRGEVDMLGAVGPDESLAAEKMPGVKLVKQPMLEVKHVILNMSRPPLNDKRIRQAIKYAFDYRAMVDFFSGLARLPEGRIPSAVPGGKAGLTPQQDLARARQLLAEAGHTSGGFELEYLGLKGLSYFEFAGTVLERSLAALGIRVTQTLVPWPQMPPLMAKERQAPHMSFLNMSMFTPDPSDMLRTAYHSANLAPRGGYNWSYYQNPEVDRLIDSVKRLSDERERVDTLVRIQRILDDDVPTIVVVEPILAQPVRAQWDVWYETLDYNYVVRFFYARRR